MKLKPSDLDKIAKKMRSVTNLRKGTARIKITVHMGTCGIASGARDILSAFLSCVEKEGVNDVLITTSGCAGLCSREPMATVEARDKPPVKYVEIGRAHV